jgi:tetratricopeptide (TPR) repeat protein
LQNMSTCQNNTNDFKMAAKNAGNAIELDAKSIKGHYQRSIALCKLHDYKNALADARKAVELDPKNAVLRENWAQVKKEMQNSDAKASQAFKSFFNQGFYNEKEGATVKKTYDKLPDFNPENT